MVCIVLAMPCRATRGGLCKAVLRPRWVGAHAAIQSEDGYASPCVRRWS